MHEGMYCDTPLITVDDLIMRELPGQSPDIIFWLGDNSPHNIWAETKEDHLDMSKHISKQLKDKFPNLGQVYPVVGNHEALPTDEFDVYSQQDNWILQDLANMWKQWLTPQGSHIQQYLF